MEPSVIEPTCVTKCPKQVHQSQRNHCGMDQFDHGKVVGNTIGGTIPLTHGIKQIINTHEEMPDEHVSAESKPIAALGFNFGTRCLWSAWSFFFNILSALSGPTAFMRSH